MNSFTQKVVSRGLQKHVNALLKEMNLPSLPCYFLDAATQMPTLFMQGTCVSFEYPRSDLPEKVKFIGPIVPQPPS
jgi:hypothetical protein